MSRTGLATPDDPGDEHLDAWDGELISGSWDVNIAMSRPKVRFVDNETILKAAKVICAVCGQETQSVTRGADVMWHEHDESVWVDLNTWIVLIKSIVAAAPRKLPLYVRVSPQRLTSIAVFLAGRKRAVLGNEWRDHLSGETGLGLPADRQVREAAGFMFAAVQYRLQDAADLLWRPVDAVLASRELSNLVVLIATLGAAVVFIRQGGLNGLADNLGSVAVVWGAACGLIRAGRRWRGVKPPKHTPRRQKR